MPATEALECYNPSLVGDFGQSSETQNADRNKDGNGQAQEDAVGNKDCCLHFAHILRIYKKLRFRVIN